MSIHPIFAPIIEMARAQAEGYAAKGERDHLVTLLRDLVKQMDDAVDIDKPSFADPRCRECTHGTTPDDWKPRTCAYHRALAIIIRE